MIDVKDSVKKYRTVFNRVAFERSQRDGSSIDSLIDKRVKDLEENRY
jgi:hypothetical protein